MYLVWTKSLPVTEGTVHHPMAIESCIRLHIWRGLQVTQGHWM